MIAWLWMQKAAGAAWRFVRKWWWLFVLALVAVVGWILRGLFTRRTAAAPTAHLPPELQPPKTISEVVKDRVERVQLEGEVEKAKVTSTAVEQHHEIDRIAADPDPVKARADLAAWLQSSL